MKILMVLEGEFPTDERVEKEALSLTHAGHEVHLLCPTLKQRSTSENYKGIHLHRIVSSSFYYKKARVACLTTPFYFSYWRKAVSIVLAQQHFDVLHIHDLPLAKVGVQLAPEFKVKLVMDFHENYPYMLKEELYTKTLVGRLLSPINKWVKYEKQVLQTIDYAVCVCPEMHNRMEVLSARPRYTILDNTVDISRWPDYVKKDKAIDRINTIYVGGLTVKRGVEVAIKGIALFNSKSEKKAYLDIYGSGKQVYIDSLLTLAKELGIEGHVTYKGYIKLPEDAQELGTYHIGLIPHLRSTHTDNTSPNKIFQYYYYKLPVLCADCNYLVRLVKETGGGLLYKDTSPEDFALKLSEMNDDTKLETLGESAYESIVDKYNWGKSAEHFCDFYDTL